MFIKSLAADAWAAFYLFLGYYVGRVLQKCLEIICAPAGSAQDNFIILAYKKRQRVSGLDI